MKRPAGRTPEQAKEGENMNHFIMIELSPQQLMALGRLRGFVAARDVLGPLWLANPEALQRDLASGTDAIGRVALAFCGGVGPDFDAGFTGALREAAKAAATNPEGMRAALGRLHEEAFTASLAAMLDVPVDAEALRGMAQALSRKGAASVH